MPEFLTLTMVLWVVVTLINAGLLVYNLRQMRQWTALRRLQLDITSTAWICRAWPHRLLQAEREALIAAAREG